MKAKSKDTQTGRFTHQTKPGAILLELGDWTKNTITNWTSKHQESARYRQINPKNDAELPKTEYYEYYNSVYVQRNTTT